MSDNEREIICIVCTQGCRAIVGKEGLEFSIKGKLCKRGLDYVKQEYLNPKRVLTTTVRIKDNPNKIIPVRTSSPVPKEKIFEIMKVIKATRAEAPLKVGDVIIPNILDTGSDVICTGSLLV